MSGKEIWKGINGYDEMYKVSSLGRVKSYHPTGKLDDGILKVNCSPYGYALMSLYKNKTAKTIIVHRIVAMHFIPNPLNKPCVNHIDGDKLNNSISNLEWCTYSENIKHSFSIGLHTPNYAMKGRTGSKCPSSKRVLGIDDSKNIIHDFESCKAASIDLNIESSYISKRAHGTIKNKGSIFWIYAEDHYEK